MSSKELLTFLRRTPDGLYRLETEDGSLMLEGRSYRELRHDLELLLGATGVPAGSLKVMIGRPRRPPRAVPMSCVSEAPLVSAG
jgi:hypothetical protein